MSQVSPSTVKLSESIVDDITLSSRTVLTSRCQQLQAIVPLTQLTDAHVMVIPTANCLSWNPTCSCFAELLASTNGPDLLNHIDFVNQVKLLLQKSFQASDSAETLIPVIFEEHRVDAMPGVRRCPRLHVILTRTPERILEEVVKTYGNFCFYALQSKEEAWVSLQAIGFCHSFNEVPQHCFINIGDRAWVTHRPKEEERSKSSWDALSMRRIVWEALRESGDKCSETYFSRSSPSLENAVNVAQRIRR